MYALTENMRVCIGVTEFLDKPLFLQMLYIYEFFGNAVDLYGKTQMILWASP